MTLYDFIFQTLELLGAIFLAPLLTGWVNQCRALFQNRTPPPLFLPYRLLFKLFSKEVLLAYGASSLFRATPYLVFSSMVIAAAIVPTLSTNLLVSPLADVIALVGLLALSRVFMALAGMDTGTAFGTLGARRDMFIGFLAEPALLMVFFTASLLSQSTAFSTIVATILSQPFFFRPEMAFAILAFGMVLLAENARIPIDNPTTHLELTMIHEAMILEYSGRHLALIEWAVSLKLFVYFSVGIALFFPHGIATEASLLTLGIALFAFLVKLIVGGVLLALFETVSAKMRIFRAPEFLSAAFLLGVLALMVHLLLASSFQGGGA